MGGRSAPSGSTPHGRSGCIIGSLKGGVVLNTTLKHGWFTEHRSWEDFCSAGLGILIVLSPVLVGENPATSVAISAGLVVVVITRLALQEVMSLQRREEVLQLRCGLGVIVSCSALWLSCWPCWSFGRTVSGASRLGDNAALLDVACQAARPQLLPRRRNLKSGRMAATLRQRPPGFV